MASVLASGRLGWFYYDGYRAKSAKAAEEAERRRRDDSFVSGLLRKRDAEAPTRDGQHPCVSVFPTESSAKPELGKCAAPGERSGAIDRFEVDLRYGNFLVRQTDLSLSDIFDVPLTRTYNSGDYIHPNRSHGFGNNTNHPFDIAPLGSRNPYTYEMLVFEDGDYLFFDRISEGTGSSDAVFQHTETSTRFYKAVTKWNGDGWTTFLTDGTKMDFPEAYNSTNMAQCALIAIRDAEGNKLELRRDDQRNLKEIITPHGRKLKFQYDDQSRIVRAEDDHGQWTRYQYNGGGMLTDVFFSSGRERHYSYDGLLMTLAEDEKHRVLVRNWYRGRTVVRQEFLNGQIVSYEYNGNPAGTYADSVTVSQSDGTRTEVETASSVPNSVKHPPK
jgi:YD repeat-containing protein